MKMKKTTIPLRILSEGNINDHWSKKHRRNKIQTQCVRFFWKRDIGKIKLPVTITLVRQAPRTLDSDNLVTAFKHVRDTIADLIIPGLQPGRADADNRLKFDYRQEQRKDYGLKIIVENLKPK